MNFATTSRIQTTLYGYVTPAETCKSSASFGCGQPVVIFTLVARPKMGAYTFSSKKRSGFFCSFHEDVHVGHVPVCLVFFVRPLNDGFADVPNTPVDRLKARSEQLLAGHAEDVFATLASGPNDNLIVKL